MIKTRIYPVTGFHIDVQESVEEVKKLVAGTATGGFIALTLDNGEPAYFQRSQIVYFTKY